MPSLTPRRPLAACLVTGLAVAAASLVTAPTATADVLDPGSTLLASAFFQTQPDTTANPGLVCTAVPPPSGPAPIAFAADGQPRPYTASGTATTTVQGSPADAQTGVASASGTLTATQAGGQLDHVRLAGTFSASVTSAGSGGKCNLQASAGGQGFVVFTLVRTTLVTITATSRRGEAIGALFPGTDINGLGNVLGGGASAVKSATLLAFGENSTGVSRLLLPAGQYTALVGSIGGTNAAAPTTGTASVDIDFDAPGSALGATTGKAGRYVTLPDTVDCAAHTATATWTKKAGKRKSPKVKKAVFTVETTKVGAAKKPVKGSSTVLRGLPLDAPFTVTASVKLANGKSVELERDYQACGT
jgi:hypothetical protein